MRINKIELENITSLKGIHTIDFDKIGELSDLFAITGPTGSGKSTILTAISMALYGEHPKGINAVDMVTMGEARGRISLTFTFMGENYYVEWMCLVLKKDGTPRNKPLATRVLYQNDIPLEKTIEEILGLNFSQFSKVVILNQGQFSDFLTSSFTHRKDLLEKLLEHHDLKNLSPFINRKLKDLKSEINNLDQQCENTLLLTEEELKEIIKVHEESKVESLSKKEEVQSLTKINENLSEYLKMAHKWHELQERMEKEKKEITLLNNTLLIEKKLLKEIKSKLEKQEQRELEIRPKIEKAIKLIESERGFNEERNQKEGEKESIESKKQMLTKKSQDTSNELDTLSKRLSSLDTLKFEKLHAQEINDEIEKVSLHSELIKQIDSIGKTIQIYSKEKIRYEEKAKLLQEESERISLWFNALYKMENKSVSEIFEKIDKDYLQVKDAKNRISDTENRLSLLNDDILTCNTKKVNLEKELETLKENQTHSKKSLPTLKKELEVENREIESLTLLEYSYHHFLKEDKSDCPVCENEISKQVIERIKDKINSNDFQKRKERTERFELEIKKIESDLLQIDSRLRFTTEVLNTCQTEEKSFISKKSILTEQMNQLILEQNKNLINEDIYNQAQKNQYQYQRNESEIKALRESWQESQQKWLEFKKLAEESNQKMIHISKDVETILKLHGISNLETALVSLKSIQRDFQEFSLLTQKIKGIENLITDQKIHLSEIEESKALLIEKIKNIDIKISSLQNEFVINDLPENPLKIKEELETALTKQRTEWEEKRVECHNLEISYEKKQSQINILKEQESGINDLITSYLSKIDPQTTHTFTLDGENLERFKKISYSNFKNIDEINSITEFYSQVLVPLKESISEEFKNLSEKTIVLKTQIEENNKQQLKLKSIIEKKAKFSQKMADYEFLAPYLLKDSFRDYALAILEESLLEVANREIDSLADGRYVLIHGKAGKRSELLVKDLWQGNSIRKVSTLSGGETFLLSLGLALGLSEITRGQTEIDSFFIDEGFGTLDEESITQVLNCLMQMQSRGKQIGLISHVIALTDQIPVRVELNKNNFGESQISLS
ncbi:MAG: SMC family ATPase [Bacteriovoracaceae bacterium]|nr:SMC family ATPase [Bacteriovoracaceae bacterium]